MERRQSSVSTARAIGAAFFAALMLKLFFFDFMIAEGESMMPAIRPGKVLLVNRLAYGFRFPWAETYALRWGQPKTGDVVVFPSPAGHTAVKRCGGLTGRDTFIALGDNSGESYDSRSYGPVPVDAIIGKVIGIK